jgi:hypothetical protein
MEQSSSRFLLLFFFSLSVINSSSSSSGHTENVDSFLFLLSVRIEIECRSSRYSTYYIDELVGGWWWLVNALFSLEIGICSRT